MKVTFSSIPPPRNTTKPETSSKSKKSSAINLINNTIMCTQLISFKDDEFNAKVTHSEQEVCQLIEAGFEYVCDYAGNKIMRRRK